MCGIVYAQDFNGKPVNNEILQRYDAQKHRGTDGYGLFDGDKKHIVKATKEHKILKWLVRYNSNLIMFHHRFPSSTPNIKSSAHPFSTGDYYGDNQYILVHNGHIWNSGELFDDHEAKKMKYRSFQPDGSFNDSESLLWDFADSIEHGQFGLDAYGAIAFICVRLHKGKLDKLYFGRNYKSPLVMKRDKDGIILSSEGDGEDIEVQKLYTWHYNSKRLTKRDFWIPSWTEIETEIDRHEYDDSDDEFGDMRDTLSCDDISWFRGKRQRLLGQTSLVHDDELDEDEIMEAMEAYAPPAQDIQSLVFDYMNLCSGHFEKAYEHLEADYSIAIGDAKTLTDWQEVRLLEAGLELLANDPQYINEHSISSYWTTGS